MDDAFLAALFPRRHRILGRRLRPYCLGHFVTLCAALSPFVADAGSGATVDAGELLVALRICSAPGWPLLSPDQFTPGIGDVVRRWWLERNPDRLQRAAQAFRDYLDDFSAFPEFWESVSVEGDEEDSDDLLKHADEGRTLTAPAALARVCGLTSRTTIKWKRAWQMPFCLPSWILATLDEMEGSRVRFLRDGDVDGSDMPPEVELSDEQLFREAVRDLGLKGAREWRKKWKAAERSQERKEKKGKRRGN